MFGHAHEMFSQCLSLFTSCTDLRMLKFLLIKRLVKCKFTEFKRFIMNYSSVLHIPLPSPRFSVRAIAAVTFLTAT